MGWQVGPRSHHTTHKNGMAPWSVSVKKVIYCSVEGNLACPVLKYMPAMTCIVMSQEEIAEEKGKQRVSAERCLSWLQSVSLFVRQGVEYEPRQLIVKQFYSFKHLWWHSMETPLLLQPCLIVDSVGFMTQGAPTYCFRGQGVVGQHFICTVASQSQSFFLNKHCSIRVGNGHPTHHSNFQ